MWINNYSWPMKILSATVFQHGVSVSINLEVASGIVIVRQGDWNPLLAELLVPSAPAHRPIREHHQLDRVAAVVAWTSAVKRSIAIGDVVQSQRRPLLGTPTQKS